MLYYEKLQTLAEGSHTVNQYSILWHLVSFESSLVKWNTTQYTHLSCVASFHWNNKGPNYSNFWLQAASFVHKPTNHHRQNTKYIARHKFTPVSSVVNLSHSDNYSQSTTADCNMLIVFHSIICL